MREFIIIINDENKINEIQESVVCGYDVMEFARIENALDFLSYTNASVIIANCYKIGDKMCENINRIKEVIGERDIPITVVSDLCDDISEANTFDLGVSEYITYPFNPTSFKKRIDLQVELSVQRRELKKLVKEKLEEVEKVRDVMVKSMAEMVEVRDITTGGHVKRTEEYVRILVNKLVEKDVFEELRDNEYVVNLIRSAPLHDIGKIGILDATLLKCGSLTEEEFEGMKQHTTLGEKAINNMMKEVGENSFLLVAKDVASAHHEGWDGSGYPRGLKGDEIPLGGRIMALADIYDALTTERPYKNAFSHEKSVELIRNEREKKLDPVIVDTFLEMEEEFKSIAAKYSNK